MNLDRLQRNWDRLGANDACWAILSHRDKRNNSWDLDEFFATGRDLIDDTMAFVAKSDIGLARSRALDFGCGAGRLTQALARHFDRVTGVDIAPSMIALADELKVRAPSCEFVLNGEPDLQVFADATFDFVCSYIVLQHMEPRFAAGYLREFARVLRPGGAIVFQLPSEPIKTLKGQLRRALATPTLQPLLNLYKRVRYRQSCAMEMYGIQRSAVEELLQSLGLTVRAVEPCTSAGPTWLSFRYLAVKAPVADPRDPADTLAGTPAGARAT